MQQSCSVCQGPAVWGGSFYLKVPNNVQYDEWLNSVQLPLSVTDTLDSPGENKHSVWLFIHVSWQGRRVGHAVILMFDIKRRLQIIFDPAEGCNGVNMISCALCRHRFHPDYTNVSSESCMAPTRCQSIQMKIEANMNVDELGVCGILCTLIMVCCLRFGYLNPNDTANMLIPLLSDPTKQIGNELIFWFNESLDIHNIDAFRKHVFPESTEGMCKVYSSRTNRLCSRKSCMASGGKNMCWQHRYILLNRMAPNMKCDTAQAPCQ